MSDIKDRRCLSVFPIGTVMKLTELSARQIRYYEEQKLITTKRSVGNRRLYSLNDIDVLLEIKEHLNSGLNMAEIKKLFEKNEQLQNQKTEQFKKTLTDEDIRRIFRDELINQSGLFQQNATMFGFGKPRL